MSSALFLPADPIRANKLESSSKLHKRFVRFQISEGAESPVAFCAVGATTTNLHGGTLVNWPLLSLVGGVGNETTRGSVLLSALFSMTTHCK